MYMAGRDGCDVKCQAISCWPRNEHCRKLWQPEGELSSCAHAVLEREHTAVGKQNILQSPEFMAELLQRKLHDASMCLIPLHYCTCVCNLQSGDAGKRESSSFDPYSVENSFSFLRLQGCSQIAIFLWQCSMDSYLDRQTVFHGGSNILYSRAQGSPSKAPNRSTTMVFQHVRS